MKIPYYPGCTLFEKAKKLDEKARKIALTFGYILTEIPDWTCCGAVFPNTLEDIGKFVGPYRMLAAAAQDSDKLLTLCSACYNVMKRTNKIIRENKNIREKLKAYTEIDYKGTVEVIHYLEFLRDTVTFDKIKEKAINVNEKKVAPYYGCLLLRPYEELKFDDPENPVILSQIIQAVGDEAIEFPSLNECCGAYLLVNEEKESLKCSEKICVEATKFGSEMIITSCPLCYFSLNKTQEIPVKYFTEYLAEALGIE